MGKLNQVWQTLDQKLLISELILALVINPFFLKVHWLPRVQVVIWLLLLVNMIFSFWVGQRLFKKGQTNWHLIIFPLAYLLAMMVFHVARYTYYFALVYLGISYLTKAMLQDAATNQTKESKLM